MPAEPEGVGQNGRVTSLRHPAGFAHDGELRERHAGKFNVSITRLDVNISKKFA